MRRARRDAWACDGYLLILVIGFGFSSVSLAQADDTWPGRPYIVAVDVELDGDGIGREVDRDRIRKIVLHSLGPACHSGDEPDKRLSVTISSRGSTCDVMVQETDMWLHRAGEAFKDVGVDTRLASSVTARLAKQAFRARAHVQRVDDQYVASVWGGRLDPSLVLADGVEQTGEAWSRAYLRFRDRDGTWRQTQDVAWTFLRLRQGESSAALDFKVDVESAFPQPLPGRLRRGEIVALITRPSRAETTYVFEDRTLGTPRGGLWVEVTPPRLSAPDAADVDADVKQVDAELALKPLRRQIDRTGRLTLTRDEVLADAQPVRLRVRSASLLIDVPVMVGAQQSLAVAVPQDRERVELAEELRGIEAALQDVVARRAVVLSRIRSAIDDSSWPKLEPLLDELKKLPDGSELRQELNAARVNAIAEARRRGDGGSISRINRECARLEKTLTSFVAPDVDDDLRAEAAALRDIQEAAKLARPEVIERKQSE